MKKLNIAVVGLGRIGWMTHIPEILARSDRFTLVAVVDASARRIEEAKKEYGVSGYTDIKQMILAHKPDVAVIATPTHMHYDHACLAMKMGCDIILEKPMAPDYETACAIAECAKSTGRKLMVFQLHRALAEPNQLLSIMNSGKLGKIFSIYASRSAYRRRADWQALRKFGGGMLNNYGPHYVDTLLYMVKERIARCFCTANTVASAGDAEDVVRILMQTQSGVTLDIDINQAAALTGPSWMVCGEYGTVRSENGPDGKLQFCLRYYNPDAVPKIQASDSLAAENRSYDGDDTIPWVEEVIPLDNSFEIPFYDKLYEYFALDKEPFVPIDETLYVMELLRDCREISEQGPKFKI